MITYLARRLARAVSVVFAAIVISFALFFIAPTDPASALCGELRCSPQRYEEIRKSLQLDQPVYDQFAGYMKGLVAGRDVTSGGVVKECPAPCLGFSFKNDQPVLGTLVSRIPVNLSIVFGAAIIFLCVGVSIGSMAARRRGSTADRALVGSTLVMSSIPYYIVALIVFLYGVLTLQVLPRPEYVSPFSSPVGWVVGLLTPWLVLGIYTSTSYARFSRGSMIEALSEDFVRTARSKGISERRVVYVHAMRSAMSPILTIFGLDIAALFVGTIFTEKIFQLQGIGITSLQALNSNDLPVIMGTVIIGAIVLVLMNLIVDIMYSVLDPRVRLA